MHEASSNSQSERAAVSAVVVTSLEAFRPCPVCGEAMTGCKTSACSDRCRAAKSRRKPTEAQTEREGRVRELLEAAVRVMARVEEPLA